MRGRIVVIILLVMAATLFFVSRGGERKRPIEYKLAPVVYADVADTVIETGNLIPAAAVNVFSPLDGKLDEIFVKNSDTVEAGDDLFTVVNELTGQERTVESPADGTITNLSVAKGGRVSPPAAGNAATVPVLTVADTTKYSVKLMINEIDIAKIKEEERANLTFDAVRDKTAAARVERVDTIGTNTQGVITYNVYLALDTTATSDLRPSMTVNAEIETAKSEHVLTVPSSAVRPYKGGKAVRLLNKKTGKVSYVPVSIGIIGAERTEILSGVGEGTKVITRIVTPERGGGLFGAPR